MPDLSAAPEVDGCVDGQEEVGGGRGGQGAQARGQEEHVELAGDGQEVEIELTWVEEKW